MTGSTSNLRHLGPLLAIGALASGSPGCSGTPRIRIDAPEARLSPMLEGVCSVFMKIQNPGDGDDALLEAKVDVPGAVTQIHALRDGRMVESGKLVVPANGLLELKPGGLHIMVFNLPKGPDAVHELTLRLRFEKSGEKQAIVKIRD